jgi:nucleoside-diphosphate-sugar epimerase
VHLGTYHIGTQDEVTVALLARMVGEVFGKRIELVPGPEAAGGTARRCPNIAKLAALGYAPKVSLREGLAITAKWYRENAQFAPGATVGRTNQLIT